MFDTVVIATDGSGSARRAVEAALDLAGKFDATVHALYVVDEGEVESTPDDVRDVLERALATTGGRALSFVREAATNDGETDADVVTAVRDGAPAAEIQAYADEVDADVIATGTRGRHGDHGFLLGSVAEQVVRNAPMPVLSVRQLEGEANPEREAV